VAAPRVVALTDIERATARAGFELQLVRRALGIGAFGVNVFRAAAVGGRVIEDHDELVGAAGGHEELYVVLTGRATFTLDGAEHDAPAGTLVSVTDPATRRGAIAAVPDTTVLVIGGVAGAAYAPGAWEATFAAQARTDAGDPEGAVAILIEELAARPGNAKTLYNLACFECLAGHLEPARAHLAEAVALDGKLGTFAATDPDLAGLLGR
jgi:hypothetical protein